MDIFLRQYTLAITEAGFGITIDGGSRQMATLLMENEVISKYSVSHIKADSHLIHSYTLKLQTSFLTNLFSIVGSADICTVYEQFDTSSNGGISHVDGIWIFCFCQSIVSLNNDIITTNRNK